MDTEGKGRRTKGDRIGEVRCPHCFSRFRPLHGAEKASCPECNWEWYLSWKGDLAKIRKPVWEKWDQQVSEEQRGEEQAG
jgi:hypothetical protein